MAVPAPSPPAVQRERAAIARRKARDAEGPVQRAVLAYFRQTLPHGFLIQSTANKPRSKVQGAREKALGAVKGWPDLAIYGPARFGSTVWFAEIKAPGGKVSDAQRDVHDRLLELGFSVRVLRSVEDARKAVADWGLPSKDSLITRRSA